MDYNHSYYCIIAYNEENKPIVLGLLNKVVTGIKNYRNTYRDLFKEIIVNTLKLRKIKYDHLEEHTVYIGKLNTIYEKVSRIYVELSRIEKLLGIYTEYNYSDDSEKFVTFKDVDRYYEIESIKNNNYHRKNQYSIKNKDESEWINKLLDDKYN